MSRSRTVYRPRRKKRSFLALPDSAQAFLARRFLDIFALTLGAAGSMLLLALASYDHNDPSANTAGTGPIQNWMGAPGAWLADLSFQTIGAGAFAFAAGFLFWSLRLLRREIVRPVALRAVGLIIASLALSVALAQTPSSGWMVHPYIGIAAARGGRAATRSSC